MCQKITIHYNEEPIYDICFEESFEGFAELLTRFNLTKKKICIVSEDNVAKYYLDEFTNRIKSYVSEVINFIFSSGEENKNLDTVSKLYEKLIINKYDRNDILIALGGGVVGDLTGFAAATYLRGIQFIQVPTSLLSQVDSSIGGKTGVDFVQYKNMVGAFYQPIAVYTNLSTLDTLNRQQFFSGLGEIIKHGLIKDREYFEWLTDNIDSIKNKNKNILREMIYRSCVIKQLVVEKDPKEKGDRALLNFGHTLGHAIEKLMNFKLLHGECVAIGMVLASYMSYKRGNITLKEYERIVEIISEFELPVTIAGLEVSDIIEASKNDKKMNSGVIKFILLEKIGKAVIAEDVTDKEMAEAVQAILVK